MMTENRPTAKQGRAGTKAECPPKLATPLKSTAKSQTGAKPANKSQAVANDIKPTKRRASKKLAGVPLSGGEIEPAKVNGDAPVQASRNSRQQASQKSASPIFDHPVGEPQDWREATLGRMRALILEAEPAVVEERKWKKPSNGMVGVPVWSLNGIICTGETYKKVVKLTFAHGASISDPSHLFNSSMEGNTRRAIDIPEGTQVDAAAFKALVKAAVALNDSPAKKAKPATKAAPDAKGQKVERQKQENVVLLSGGNPQIAKADGDAPVQAYIAAMPGWKSDIGKLLDAIIVKNAPNVKKAVKWNSPFYGIEGQGWFLNFHVLTRYVKVTFFSGTSLQPPPTGCTPKTKDARWIDIYEDDELDETQMANWVRQAAKLPGWIP